MKKVQLTKSQLAGRLELADIYRDDAVDDLKQIILDILDLDSDSFDYADQKIEVMEQVSRTLRALRGLDLTDWDWNE